MTAGALRPDTPRAPLAPTRLVLLGDPVSHSLSPRFQNAALDAAGLSVRYAALHTPADDLARVLRELGAIGAAGNITVPHKERASAIMDRCTPLATRTGAVNTFWSDADGALVGHNTDVAGVDATIAHLLRDVPHDVLATRPCALLGAGGSAAAVLVALVARGAADIRVWSRTSARIGRLAERAGVTLTVCESADEAVRGAALVINSTPIGMRDEAMPVSVTALDDDAVVFDLVYRPGETAFVRAARARGLTAEDGLRMLVEQGAAAFACWFGQEPSRDAMWRALERHP